jgi:hypothetical protein
MENQTFTQHARREATSTLVHYLDQGETNKALLIGITAARLFECYLQDTAEPCPYAFIDARRWAMAEVSEATAKPWAVLQ